MMKTAYGSLKLKPNEFWRLTIRELKVMIDAKKETNKYEMDLKKWEIWQAEALRRQKRLMSYKRFIAENKTRKLYGKELEQRRQHHESLAERFAKATGKEVMLDGRQIRGSDSRDKG